ncbi:hypothetical protein BCR33DRAFT_305185 [Rhizoclosmatium globosum]|uniref:Uncharacterized protein n=1 Tax=Rhizoclosmatium globosum TaxID=329046 RepID=A0A1Y2C5M4_9FUNG|nr:hypothetical protein BCR33DRAFT_305185 [Rhizoclosmatium globosum]|eukprot:ORY42174.1 hypothetical protein BCR33DRAFT_305185 [Rhizoclosmatium globosum]
MAVRTTDGWQQEGWTPIVWAASNGHVQVVERLIENGADCGVTSDSGKSIWDVLRHSEHRDTIVPVLGNPPDEKDLASADWVVPDFDDMDSLTFDWTICRYDQMIVFDEASLDRILHTTIHELHTHSLDADTPAIVAANIIFLCARFAHYMNPPEYWNGYLQRLCGY